MPTCAVVRCWHAPGVESVRNRLKRSRLTFGRDPCSNLWRQSPGPSKPNPCSALLSERSLRPLAEHKQPQARLIGLALVPEEALAEHNDQADDATEYQAERRPDHDLPSNRQLVFIVRGGDRHREKNGDGRADAEDRQVPLRRPVRVSASRPRREQHPNHGDDDERSEDDHRHASSIDGYGAALDESRRCVFPRSTGGGSSRRGRERLLGATGQEHAGRRRCAAFLKACAHAVDTAS